ncbi:MAG: AAA family ATPase, partial [Candidatus Poseidoniaceae archaeon]
MPRSLSLEGIADGIGVVRSALFQPMSTMEEQGLIRTRQAHVIGGGRRKRKVVHITEVGRNNLRSSIDDLPEPRSRTSSKLKGQLPELTHLHGRMPELQLIEEALKRNVPIHLRGMPGIGKSTLARCVLQHLVEKDIEVHWVQLDAYCDVQEAMNRMEVDAPHILDVEGYATYLEQRKVMLVFDDIHSISQRHQSSFSSLFRALEGHKIPFMLIGRDRDAFSIDGVEIDLGPLDPSDAIQLLDPELGDERTSIVEALGGHPLAILLYDASTPLPEAHLDVRAYVEQVVLGEASTEVHDAMSLFLV